MIGTLVLTGGAFCAGWGIYQQADNQSLPQKWAKFVSRFRSMPLAHYLKSTDPIFARSASSEDANPQDYMKKLKQLPAFRQTERQDDLLVSTAFLGMVAIGGIGLIPLKFVAAPLLAYRAVPALHSTFELVQHDRRAAVGIAETAALVLVFVNGAWLAGSAGFAVYHLGRWFVSSQQQEGAAQPNSPFCVRRNDQEINLTADHLQAGDWVSIPASQLVPVDSQVVDGTAWVSDQFCGGMDTPFTAKAGDRLAKDTFVLAGNLWLEVLE